MGLLIANQDVSSLYFFRVFLVSYLNFNFVLMKNTTPACIITTLLGLAAPLMSLAENKYPDFALGADISWYTQMEAEGVNVYDAEGALTSVPALTADYGFDAIRLRVFVDPQYAYCLGAPQTWCDKADLLVKAREARDNGQRVMVDFHFSDNWCHPGQQWTPAAWTDTSTEGLARSASAHVADVLNTCRQENVDVAWVQIGNETGGGFLLQSPDGKTVTDYGVISNNGAEGFITIFNAAARTVKEIYPDAKRVLMTAHGAEWDTLDWTLGVVNDALDYDLFGVSIYPQPQEGADKDNTTMWRTRAEACVDAVKKIHQKYGKRTLICETGMNSYYTSAIPWGVESNSAKCNEDQLNFMEYFIPALKATGVCDGVLWWEPEIYNWKYQTWSPTNPDWTMQQGAMTYQWRPGAVWEYLKSISTFHPSLAADDVTDNTPDDGTATYYNLMGETIDHDKLTPGIYIKRHGKCVEKIAITN